MRIFFIKHTSFTVYSVIFVDIFFYLLFAFCLYFLFVIVSSISCISFLVQTLFYQNKLLLNWLLKGVPAVVFYEFNWLLKKSAPLKLNYFKLLLYKYTLKTKGFFFPFYLNKLEIEKQLYYINKDDYIS